MNRARKKSPRIPYLVAIVGGSASGKSWLTDQLQNLLGDKAARLSLDDFYRDRSHLPPGRRARINYDHPRAIDWQSVERVLQDCLAGRVARVPSYDFATHSRGSTSQSLRPKPVILMEGLWLLRRRSLRRIFNLSIYIDCPAKTRVARRMARDVALRGRTRESVRRQFMENVEPMHAVHVVPQARWADICLRTPIQKKDLLQLVEKLSKAGCI
ncbi:MAG TPA: uridine kinase [Verrucomicrobiae bacterium]|jgi:uridine kinase|nr:uridine kinase [Verrucomicrobiae bacterium]